jgi:cephalosporin hydroxylase
MLPLTADEQRIVDQFHELYYRLWGFSQGRGTIDLHWMGFQTLKCPMDLWTYQEILVETAPDVIVECGTRFGGSAAYLASLCDVLGRGRVISIDIEDLPGRPVHPRITYLRGSSTSAEIVAQVQRLIEPGERVMAILDSDHSAEHVERELEIYHALVTPGCYLIVEDTNVNGHPVFASHGPGPMEAVEVFLLRHQGFVVDHARERFLMTLNPSGFLLRTG